VAAITVRSRPKLIRNGRQEIIFLPLTPDDFGGAVPPQVLFPSAATPQNSQVAFFGDFNPFGLKYVSGELGNNLQQQINVTDNLSYAIRSHQLKFGLDYRRLTPEDHFTAYQAQYIFLPLANVIANNMVEAAVISRTPATLVFPNWSLFAHLEADQQCDRDVRLSLGI
jgi:hypothetical protein